MPNLTAANSVNLVLKPSRQLSFCIVAILSLIFFLVFFQTALPLEAKTLLAIFLIKEANKLLTSFGFSGAFFMHIEGHCRYQQQEFLLSKCLLVTPWLIVFDIQGYHSHHRFFLCQDSVVNQTDYRHLSRVSLSASPKDFPFD